MKKSKLLFGLCVSSLAALSVSQALTSCSTEDDGKLIPIEEFGIYFDSTYDPNNIPVIVDGGSFEGYQTEHDTLQISIANANQKNYGSEEGFKYDIEDSKVARISNQGAIEFLEAGETKLKITALNTKSKDDDVSITINLKVNDPRYKTGVANFAASSYTEKLEILGKLENYAIKNHLTGLTLFESGGFVVYNDRIKLPQKNGKDIDYINGYGFGIFTEGSFDPNKKLSVTHTGHEAWTDYYHTITNASVPNICYMDDQGSQSADLYSYISSGLYATKMNDTKDGYEYYPLLAKSTNNNVSGDPIPMVQQEDGSYQVVENPSSSELYSGYRVYVKTGKDGVKYSTLSTNPTTQKYNNTEVKLEDYAYAYRMLLTQRNDFYRGAEMISSTAQGTLKGAMQYYNATGKGTSPDGDKALFDEYVGLKTGSDANGEYIDFEFQSPLTPFYAKINLSSNLVMPTNENFVKEIGVENYAKFNEKSTLSPKDTVLSVGPYVLEQFGIPGQDQEIVFTKNSNWFEFDPNNPQYNISGKDRYNFPGVHMRVLSALQSDTEAGIKEFEANRIDATGLTQQAIKEQKFLNKRKRTIGDSTFKLNINSTTEEEWEQLFGINGTITQQSESSYWNVKPFMSNDNFLKALSLSIDRKSYAETRGQNVSQSYFAPAYLWDPEGNEATAHPELTGGKVSQSYADTNVHKENLSSYYPETYGYNKDAAIRLFRTAINEMVAKRQITLPYNGELIIEWMNPNDTKEYGADLEKMIESIVNDPAVSNGKFKLDVINHDGTTDYQEVYNKMRKGQFDLGFGSISGMTNDPLGFMEVLKTDNSSGFTLNFGTDTSVPSQDLQYKGNTWSFDSLWAASVKGVIIDDLGVAYKNPISVTKFQKGSTSNNKITYKVTMEIVNAAGATIDWEKYLKTNSATIGYKYREDNTDQTGSYNVSLDGETYEFKKIKVEEGTTKTTVTAEFTIPSTFKVKVGSQDKTINQSNFTSITLNVNYTLIIDGQTSFNTYSYTSTISK